MLTHTDGGGDGARKLALPIPLRGPRIAARMVSRIGIWTHLSALSTLPLCLSLAYSSYN